VNIVDGDSHLTEPLDLYERHLDPSMRDRAVKFAHDPVTGGRTLLCDNRQLKLRDIAVSIYS